MKIRLDILCIFILFILIFISFSNFESESKTINVTVIDASSDFVRVMLDIYGYTPNDGRVSVKIESTGGQFIQQTYLNVVEKNDFMWGAQMSFIRTSSSGSSYNVFVYDEDGGFLGSTNFSLTGAPSSTSSSTSQPTITYYDTFLSLQVRDSSKEGYIQVKPTLAIDYSRLSNYDVSIYVDGNYKARAFSDSWSNNIWAGTGSHTIKASVPERTDASDSSIRYRASSDIVNYFVKGTIPTPTQTPTPPQIPTPTQTPTPPQIPTPTDASFPVEYVVIAVAIAAAVGIAITLSRRKKTAPVISVSPTKAQATQTQDDTQFWVCPHCGGDTQYRNGKQYCSSCNVYL